MPAKPKEETLEVVPIRLPAADVFTLKTIAAQRKRPYTGVARFLLQRGLESYRKDGLLWEGETSVAPTPAASRSRKSGHTKGSDNI